MNTKAFQFLLLDLNRHADLWETRNPEVPSSKIKTCQLELMLSVEELQGIEIIFYNFLVIPRSLLESMPTLIIGSYFLSVQQSINFNEESVD